MSTTLLKAALAAAACAVLTVGAGLAPAHGQCSPDARGCAAPYPYATGLPASGWSDPAFGYYRGRGTGPGAAYGAASHLGPDPGGGYFHMGNDTIGRTD